MQFKTHNEITITPPPAGLSGFCLKNTTYAKLCAAFGQPLSYSTGQTDAEWYVQFNNGVVAVIYNYKTGQSYLGKNGTPVENITGADWHISSNKQHAVKHVRTVLAKIV